MNARASWAALCCILRVHCPNLIKLGLSRTQINDDQIRILMAVGLSTLWRLI
uniref:Uncharacterized protein n=1 Tax=Arundo donax TaxID=35708 RepID=A0A0A8ZWJ8_ARUDO